MELKFMEKALEYAQEALDVGEVPVGCVFVLEGKVVVGGRNRTNELLNGTAHAELVCLGEIKNQIHLVKQMDLYVTVEPCIQCAAAIRQIGIRHVYFGAFNDKFGGNGTILSIHSEYETANLVLILILPIPRLVE
jgi:tRNA-specific adenosine deaminase 2